MSGPRTAVFMVSGIGTDAEAAGAVRAAARAKQRDRALMTKPSVVGGPHSVEIECGHGCVPPKNRKLAISEQTFTGGEEVWWVTTLIIVLLGLATAGGTAMIVSVRLAYGGPNC
jgi:hypothetical protein